MSEQVSLAVIIPFLDHLAKGHVSFYHYTVCVVIPMP